MKSKLMLLLCFIFGDEGILTLWLLLGLVLLHYGCFTEGLLTWIVGLLFNISKKIGKT